MPGITVTRVEKGVVLDRSSHVVLDGLSVQGTGEEGIHLRTFSTDNLVTRCDVSRTGLSRPAYGEGVYVGSAVSNWGTYSGGRPDASDRNRLVGNHIHGTGAENVDVKEGTTGGVVSGNTLDGTGCRAAGPTPSSTSRATTGRSSATPGRFIVRMA